MKAKRIISRILLFLIFLVTIMIHNNCTDDGVVLPRSSMFKNPDDTTTTSISVTIPRIEVSRDKSSEYGLFVYVSVSDQDGNVLTAFTERNFRLRFSCVNDDDTLDIRNHRFSQQDQRRNRVAVGNTMDYSGSMSNQDVVDMEAALMTFVRMKHPDDYMQIIKFDTRVEVMNPFTNDTTILIDAIKAPFTRGWTAYYQAVYEGLQEAFEFVQQNQGLFPAIIAFTDGLDNSSRISLDGLIDEAIQMNIPVYTVGFGSVNETAMRRLADETGGRYFYTPTGQQIQDLYHTISGQLGSMYGLTASKVNLPCDELVIVVEVTYESAHGKHEAIASRPLRLH